MLINLFLLLWTICFQLKFGSAIPQRSGFGNVCYTPGCQKTAQEFKDAIDTSVNPCEDFHQYACGNWIKKHPLTPTQSKYSSLVQLDDQLKLGLKKILENVKDISYEPFAKVDAFYKSCINLAQIEKLKEAPLLNYLNKLMGGWPLLKEKCWNEKNFDWIQTLAELGRMGTKFIFKTAVSPDPKHNTVNVISVDQPVFDMPPSFLRFAEFQSQRDAYKTYIKEVATLLQNKPLTEAQNKDIQNMLTLEILLSQIISLINFRQTINALYNPMTIEEFITKFGKDVNFMAYFQALFQGIVVLKPSDQIIVNDIPFFEKFGALMKKTPNRIIANLMAWNFIQQVISFLPSSFLQVKNKFDKAIMGTEKTSERWLECVDLTNRDLKDYTGMLYVNEYFPPESKKEIEFMVGDLKESFKEIVKRTEWMDSETKNYALLKVDAMKVGIGYPDKYNDRQKMADDIKDLKISCDDFLENHVNIMSQFGINDLRQINKPYQTDTWLISPGEIDAQYNPLGNIITFPAATLQEPWFNLNNPRFRNYGSVGSVIGHEITHGFDVSGKDFGADGNIYQWWKDAALNSFLEKTQCMIKQYNLYDYKEEKMNVTGSVTLPENIADNGGVKESYMAYKRSESTKGVEPALPGLNYTPDQLFFLSYGLTWCTNYRKEELIKTLTNDVHAPSKYRINGVLANSEDFQKAFNCPDNSKMVGKPRCTVW